MAGTKWTQAMDGSPAEVLLAPAAAAYDRDAWPDNLPSDAYGRIVWQHGPIQEVGRNGILLEELLENVLIPRLQGFNRDKIPCPECQGGGYQVDPDGGRVTCSCGNGVIVNPFRNRETSLAITHLEEGLNWLKRRTELRRRQNVEGTFQPHRSP